MTYFSSFPQILYNQNFASGKPNNVLVSDIFFRTKFREVIKNENISYYFYTIKDNETPETLARLYYGNPELYWIIFYVNDIVDPYYDWPLSSENFQSYIIEKYGSLEYAQTTIHHYEMVITTTDSATGEEFVNSFEIDYDDARTNEGENVPHEDYIGLAEDQYPIINGNFKDGYAVGMVISRNAITIYDQEYKENEKKRNIKLINKDYYPTILTQMNSIAKNNGINPLYREIRNY